MNRLLRSSVVLAGLAASALGARAAPVTIDLTGWLFGGPIVGASLTKTAVSGGNFSALSKTGVGLGALAGTINYGSGASAFTTYCLEIYEDISVPSGPLAYNTVSPGAYTTAGGANGWGPGAGAIATNLGKLLSYALPLVTTASDAAALQLAIWEAIYEEPTALPSVPGAYLTTGNFSVGLVAASITSLADSYLSHAAMSTSTLGIKIATMDGKQDLLVIPEPTSIALVLLGLGAAGAASRRRGVPAAAA